MSFLHFFPKTVLKFVTSRMNIWSRKSKFKTIQVIFKTVEENVGKKLQIKVDVSMPFFVPNMSISFLRMLFYTYLKN